jgi:hypothetical protein
MPKSKTRGSLKEHRKRVIIRNQRILGEKRKMEQFYNNMMNEVYEKFLAENPQLNSSGQTETEVVETQTEDGKNINDISVDYTPVVPDAEIKQ